MRASRSRRDERLGEVWDDTVKLEEVGDLKWAFLNKDSIRKYGKRHYRVKRRTVHHR